MATYTRFQDVARKYTKLEGEKRTLNDIINREILIFDFNISPSKFVENNKDCLKVQWAFPDRPEEKFVFFTGSKVLLNQIKGIEEHLRKGPVLATMKKEGRYFTFT